MAMGKRDKNTEREIFYRRSNYLRSATMHNAFTGKLAGLEPIRRIQYELFNDSKGAGSLRIGSCVRKYFCR